MKVLIVEDDSMIGGGTQKALIQDGMSVDWVKNVEDASSALETARYDLIVLDIGLPDGSGLKILSDLRKRAVKIPVLLLTALNATSDRVRGLDLGADDYMTKPFELEELSARIRALHRRSQGIASPTLTVAGITLDPAAHTIIKNHQPIDLGSKEFAILQRLFENAGRVVSKTDLEENLYGWEEEISSNAIRGVGYITEKS
jgi:DNA-binding response OmpR family regulator